MWNKLYRSGLFKENDIPFPCEVKLGSDQAMMFVVFPRAQKITYIVDKFYHYRQHESNTLSFYIQNPPLRLREHVKMTLWVLEQWQKTGDIVGHEVDWANWALEHIFYEDVKATDLAAVQDELRKFLKAFDEPVFCRGLKPYWAKHLDNLRLIARASIPELVVNFEQLQRDLAALKDEKNVSAKMDEERDRALRSALSEIEISLRRRAEAFRQENERLGLRVGELESKNKQFQQLENALSVENVSLREQMMMLTKEASALSERCAALEQQMQTITACIAPVLTPYKSLRYLKKNGVKEFCRRVGKELKQMKTNSRNEEQ